MVETVLDTREGSKRNGWLQLTNALQCIVSGKCPNPQILPITLTCLFLQYPVQCYGFMGLVDLDCFVSDISQLNTKIGTFMLCHVDEESIIDSHI